MFILTTSGGTNACRTNDGETDGADFSGIDKVCRVVPVLTSQFVVLLFALCVWTTSAHGQVLYGSMVGNVTDPNGAAVPGAKVEVVNVGTKATKIVTTDENSFFSFTDLTPGAYNLTVSAASFKKELRQTVQIEANKVRRIDTQLQVG